MSVRALVGVAVALVVLTVVALIVQLVPRDAARTDSLFAPELRTRFDNIESIVIGKAANEVVATLRPTPEGWSVVERGGYPADTAKIRAALTALADARIVEEKTANPELYDRLGLGDLSNSDARGISVTLMPEDPRTPTMILGDTQGTSYRYARLVGNDRSYLISTDPDLPRETAEWLVADILDIRGERVERIVITHADGEQVEVFKTEVGQSNYSVANIPEGRELQYPGVANVTGNALRGLRLEDVAPLEASPPPSEFVTEFTTFDGLIVHVDGLRIDDEGWLVLSARPDSELSRPGNTTDDAVDAADDVADDTTTNSATDPAEEAATINARVANWRYRIPSYQYDQLSRRMDDLLRAEDLAN